MSGAGLGVRSPTQTIHHNKQNAPAIAITNTFPEQQRNQAPGIPDRRKSLRPGRAKASPRLSLAKGGASSIRAAMADDVAEVKAVKEKDDSDDEKPVRMEALPWRSTKGTQRNNKGVIDGLYSSKMPPNLRPQRRR